MQQPTLILMAAGLGSRYGGLKQIAPVDDAGHILMDFSLYDARRAGFQKVIFVINPKLEREFRQAVGDRMARHLDVHYAFQEADALPQGFCMPQGRTRPWGTAHALLAAKSLVDGPFAALNADDYYGTEAFRCIHDFLTLRADAGHHAMVGYRLANTLTENGHVARGVCRADERGALLEVVERTRIESRPGGGAFTEDGEHFTFLPGDTTVSMNLWGFGREMMEELEARFAPFLRENLPVDPLGCEYLIPRVVNALLQERAAHFQVLRTPDRWHGVTYAADMPALQAAIAQMKADGLYPHRLWEAR